MRACAEPRLTCHAIPYSLLLSRRNYWREWLCFRGSKLFGLPCMPCWFLLECNRWCADAEVKTASILPSLHRRTNHLVLVLLKPKLYPSHSYRFRVKKTVSLKSGIGSDMGEQVTHTDSVWKNCQSKERNRERYVRGRENMRNEKWKETFLREFK